MKNFLGGRGGFLGYILKFYWALWATFKNFSWALWATLESEIGAFVARNIGNTALVCALALCLCLVMWSL